jgi:hypothetical protein
VRAWRSLAAPRAQDAVTTAVTALLLPAGAAAADASLTPSAAAAFFATRLASPAPAAAPPPCASCASPVPHAPAAHLCAPDACAAAAAAAALLRRATPWRASLNALPPAAASEACCFRLALASPFRSSAGVEADEQQQAGTQGTHGDTARATIHGGGSENDDDGDDDDDDAWLVPIDAVGTYALRRLGLDGADEAVWRALPPWLLAAACGAHAPLCDAYISALLRRPPRRTHDAAADDAAAAASAALAARRDAAARLRCVLAAGGGAAARARDALAQWGCLWTPPAAPLSGAKRPRADAADEDDEVIVVSD